MNKILFLIFYLFWGQLCFSQTIDNNDILNKLNFSVAFYNKTISSDSDLVFILKIGSNSIKEQYIPADYYCSKKGEYFGNISYEIVYCSPDDGSRSKARTPLLSPVYDKFIDSLRLKPFSEYLFQARGIDNELFFRTGLYKIRFSFINENTP